MKSLEFESVLFNFHDVILLMTALQCLLFALLLHGTNSKRVKSTLFLTAFLFAHALIPLNELMMWGAEFKVQVREAWPKLYFLPGIAYYLDSLLLFLCIKSLVFKDFRLKRADLLHLLPFVSYLVFLWVAFYSNPSAVRTEMINSESFVYSTNYVTIEFFSKLVRVCYAIACFVLISRYDDLLQDKHSNMEKNHISWLRALVVGFLFVMLSEMVLASAKIAGLEHEIYSNIGLTGYYTTFLLVNLLVFTAIRSFGIFEQVSSEEPAKKPIDETLVNSEVAADIDTRIRQNKTYMEPDITLDTLAEALDMMPRDLSMLINRYFGINFYEFINRYRIEEAKRMLTAPEHEDTTITDIYLAVGFNSKSVFYTFFKKFEGVTPTSYRQTLG
jgi:AraC-like DNA-binding protein